MKHVIQSIEVAGDYLCVTVGGNVGYVALIDLPTGVAAQDALIEKRVDDMLAALPKTVPVKFARAASVVARLKPAAIVVTEVTP